jgi:hypothetical protein
MTNRTVRSLAPHSSRSYWKPQVDCTRRSLPIASPHVKLKAIGQTNGCSASGRRVNDPAHLAIANGAAHTTHICADLGHSAQWVVLSLRLGVQYSSGAETWI